MEIGAHAARAAVDGWLPAHLDDGLEDVERKLLGMDDVAEVVQRRAALLHIIHADVVLPQKLLGFDLRHGSPLTVGTG
jgi:hypothetical protein